LDYKKTLNLPHTDFPMRANLAQREPEMLRAWEEMDLYQRIVEQAKGNPSISCMMDPLMPTETSTWGMY